MKRLLREASVQEARDERLAADIAAATGLSVSAVGARLRRKDGRFLLRNVFKDVWPARIDELGALPARDVSTRDDLVEELARLLGTTSKKVIDALRSARRSTVKTALSDVWGNPPARTLDDVASMRSQEARELGLAPQIATLLGIEVKDAQRRIANAHGRAFVSSVFAGQWPRETPPKTNGSKLLASQYEKLEMLGAGGMGEVWKARDLGSRDRPLVALKFIKPGGDAEPEDLIREFEKASVVTHPNVCKYLCTQKDAKGNPFLVIAYGGEPLSARATSGVPVAKAVEWISAAAAGLDALHDADLLHLDVKPSNLLIDDKGVVTITDFGVALGLRRDAGRTAVTSSIKGFSERYAAPEVIFLDGPTKRSDQFSLALTFCELVGGDRGRVDAYKGARLSGLSAAQNEAVQKALARDQDKRHKSCTAFAQSLADRASRGSFLEKWTMLLKTWG